MTNRKKPPLDIRLGICGTCCLSIAPRETGVIKISDVFHHFKHFPELKLFGVDDLLIRALNQSEPKVIPDINQALFLGWNKLMDCCNNNKAGKAIESRVKLIEILSQTKEEIVNDKVEIITIGESFIYRRLLLFLLLGIDGGDINILQDYLKRFPKLMENVYYAWGKNLNISGGRATILDNFIRSFKLPFKIPRFFACKKSPNFVLKIPKRIPF